MLQVGRAPLFKLPSTEYAEGPGHVLQLVYVAKEPPDKSVGPGSRPNFDDLCIMGVMGALVKEG
jgi:hypothetical protein